MHETAQWQPFKQNVGWYELLEKVSVVGRGKLGVTNDAF